MSTFHTHHIGRYYVVHFCNGNRYVCERLDLFRAQVAYLVAQGWTQE